MRKIKTLHLASFDGNIGDNANHNGVNYLWKKYLSEYDFDITQLEMREFYQNWKWRVFDNNFATMVNQYDLFVCGGGNYFELWVENSPTGTTVAIPLDVLNMIKTPCLFYALGLDPYKGAPTSCVSRFKKFLDHILDNPQFLVSVRNDGSLASAHRIFGSSYAEQIHLMPDGGHFVQPEEHFHPELAPNTLTIGVNLAGDMPDFRFNTSNGANIDDFKHALHTVLTNIITEIPNVNLLFYPHIYKDYEILSQFINLFEDHLRRKRITVAPYLHGQGAEKYFFDLYRKCALNIGMRLHANICSVGLKIPSIGIITHPQLRELYSYFGMSDRAIGFAEKSFIKKLEILIMESLEYQEQLTQKYTHVMEYVQKDAETFLKTMKNWLDSIL